MAIMIHSRVLPHTDPDTSAACYCDTLGFEVRLDVDYGISDRAVRDPTANLIRIREMC